MEQRRVLCLGLGGFHRMAYTEWGDPANPRVLLCVHGLTRNGRDFDALARALSARYRVVCPDLVGRGESDRLADPAQYAYPQYCADMNALIARLGVERVDWLGTSMGGIIGMMMAARPNSPVARLILNDIGPRVAKAGLARLATYVGKDPRFAYRTEAEAYFRRVMATFGPLTDAQWAHFVDHGVEPAEGGGYRLRYDPAIGEAFKAVPAFDIELWPFWDLIGCPVLAIRGAESDLFLEATAREMAVRGPRAQVATLQGVGHAPALMADEQIALIQEWLA
ncbi:MAG: alpha/beta hydrolase [Alphaproteobacteria bacterium]|nr:alpha/beta hydrolase [Alphaproteobacteria bacterium]